MARIVGIFGKTRDTVLRMIRALAPSQHGSYKVYILEGDNYFFAEIGTQNIQPHVLNTDGISCVWDGLAEPSSINSCIDGKCLIQFAPLAFAAFKKKDNEFFIYRDMLGIVPMYYVQKNGETFFASEVKALIGISQQIYEFPPGSVYSSKYGWQKDKKKFYQPLKLDANTIAENLRNILEQVIVEMRASDECGAWLSGGLDSSAIAGLLSRHVRRLHTFSIGLSVSRDILFANKVAEHLNTTHHVKIVTLKQLVKILPEVIYRLESFDAPLVRSTLTNYLLAHFTAEYVNEVFSGEGGDELFAGYSYLKLLSKKYLIREVQSLPFKLHNTALQRIDRSTASAGLTVLLPFLDSRVFHYAMRIPLKFKLHKDKEGKKIEKWILRKALRGILPDEILVRPKAKFWEGTGLHDLLLQYAENTIDDEEFMKEKMLPDGTKLRSKEELLYYRIFRENFGDVDLSFVGRTVEGKNFRR